MKRADDPTTGRAWADPEYDEHQITSVLAGGGDYELMFDGVMFCQCPDPGFPIHAGDTLTLWGRGLGYPIRGQAINQQVLWYRTADEDRAYHEEQRRQEDAKEQSDYAERLNSFARRITALPDPFQRRMRRFLLRRSDWGWRYGEYELFACEQAFAFARRFPTIERLAAFHSLPYEQQIVACPEMSDQHSGNTFDAAYVLSRAYLTMPEAVWQVHGALCPLVGCQKYGCWAVETQEQS